MKSTFPLALGVLLITSGAAFATDSIPPDAAVPSTQQMAPAAAGSTSTLTQQTQAPKDAATSTTTTSESATTSNGDTQKTDATQVKTSEYQSTTAAPVVEGSSGTTGITGTSETTTTTTGAGAPSNNVQKLFNFLQHSKTQTQAGATPDKSASPSTTGTQTP